MSAAASPTGAARSAYDFDCPNHFDFNVASPAQDGDAVDKWFGEISPHHTLDGCLWKVFVSIPTLTPDQSTGVGVRGSIWLAWRHASTVDSSS